MADQFNSHITSSSLMAEELAVCRKSRWMNNVMLKRLHESDFLGTTDISGTGGEMSFVGVHSSPDSSTSKTRSLSPDIMKRPSIGIKMVPVKPGGNTAKLKSAGIYYSLSRAHAALKDKSPVKIKVHVSQRETVSKHEQLKPKDKTVLTEGKLLSNTESVGGPPRKRMKLGLDDNLNATMSGSKAGNSMSTPNNTKAIRRIKSPEVKVPRPSGTQNSEEVIQQKQHIKSSSPKRAMKSFVNQVPVSSEQTFTTEQGKETHMNNSSSKDSLSSNFVSSSYQHKSVLNKTRRELQESPELSSEKLQNKVEFDRVSSEILDNKKQSPRSYSKIIDETIVKSLKQRNVQVTLKDTGGSSEFVNTARNISHVKPVSPKSPASSKSPASLKLRESPKKPASSKLPSSSMTPASPKKHVSSKLPASSKTPPSPKKPTSSKTPASPKKPTSPKTPASPKKPTSPKTPASPKKNAKTSRQTSLNSLSELKNNLSPTKVDKQLSLDLPTDKSMPLSAKATVKPDTQIIGAKLSPLVKELANDSSIFPEKSAKKSTPRKRGSSIHRTESVSEPNGEQVMVPTKRKYERKKKIKVAEEKNETGVADIPVDTSNATIAKRPRGRPKKQPSDKESKDLAAVGRSKKVKEGSDMSTTDVESQPKRKRAKKSSLLNEIPKEPKPEISKKTKKQMPQSEGNQLAAPSQKHKDKSKSKKSVSKMFDAYKKLRESDSSFTEQEFDSSALSQEESESVDMPLICFQEPTVPTKQQLNSEKKKQLINVLSNLLDKEGKKKRIRGRRKQKGVRGKSSKIRKDATVSEKGTEERTIVTASGTPRRRNQRRTGRRFSVTGNWYIASGYLNDVISLLEDFENSSGWRFRDFAECWRRKSFSLVYRGRQSFKELLEFSEEIALLTQRFIGPFHATKRRIGALYTLYGLYYKFPVGHFFSLRFELNEYKSLLELVMPFRCNTENPDPAFIFRKLELKGAIQHCATSCEPCYDFHNEERDLIDVEYGKQKLAKSSAVNIAIPKVQLEADMELLSHYHATKAKLTGNPDEPEPERALTLIKSDFPNNISSDLKDLRLRTLNELGMISNRGSSDGCDQIARNSAESLENSEEETLQNNSELDTILHAYEDRMLDIVNEGRSAQVSQVNLENNQKIRDKSMQEFMKPPTEKELRMPLELASRVTGGRKEDIDISLSLNIKLPQSSDSVLPTRVSLEPTDLTSEDAEDLLPQPLPRKRKRGRKRPAALLSAARVKPSKIQKKAPPYNPCAGKSLADESEEESLAPVPGISQFSSTSIPTPEPPVHKNKRESGTVDVNVKMTSGEREKTVKVKMKVTVKQLREISKDPNRLLNFKKKLEPLIKLTLKGYDRDRVWFIQDISLCNDQKVNCHKTKESQKPLCFRQRFECLKHDSDESDEETSSEESNISEEAPIKKSDIDLDFVPPTAEDIKEEMEIDALEDSLLVDDYYTSSSEDEEYHKFFRRREHRRRVYEIQRGPLDSDKLIRPKGNVLHRIKMIPVSVGGKIRYFPIDQGSEEKKPDDSEGENSNKENIVEDLLTWNDFSSPNHPPYIKKKRYPISSNDNFSILYPGAHTIREHFHNKATIVKTENADIDTTVNTVTKSITKSETGSQNVDSVRHKTKQQKCLEPDSKTQQSKIDSPKTVERTLENNTPRRSTRIRKLKTYSPFKTYEKPRKGKPSISTEAVVGSLLPEVIVKKISVKHETLNDIEELAGDWEDVEDITSSKTVDSNTPGKKELISASEKQIKSSLLTVCKKEPGSPVAYSPSPSPPCSPPNIDIYPDENSDSGENNVEDSASSNKALTMTSNDTETSTNNKFYAGPSQTTSSSTAQGDRLDSVDIVRGSNAYPPGTIVISETDQFDALPEDSVKLCMAEPPETEVYEASGMPPPAPTGLGNLLFYKIKSTDGKDIFIPVQPYPPVDIEILNFDSPELKVAAGTQTASFDGASQFSISESAVPPDIAESATPKSMILQQPLIGSTQISVSNISHPQFANPAEALDRTLCEGGNFGSFYTEVTPSMSTDITPTVSHIQTPGEHQSPSLKQELPKCYAAPVSSKKLLTPSLTKDIQSKCSFLFSPKLRTLTKNNLRSHAASGKPPSPTPVEKPRVKFLMKGVLKGGQKVKI